MCFLFILIYETNDNQQKIKHDKGVFYFDLWNKRQSTNHGQRHSFLQKE